MQAFTDAGGETFLDKICWNATELDFRFSSSVKILSDRISEGGTTKPTKYLVRPFILF